jgi:N-acetylmuramoyl-L-alanine amidase
MVAFAGVGVAGTALIAWFLLGDGSPSAAAEDGGGWPSSAARLAPPATTAPADFGRRRVFVDAGHGAENNSGNLSALCQKEQDFTLDLSQDLARRLQASSHFEVRLARSGSALVAYADRVRAADAWRAEAFVSLHSDVRGPAGAGSCPQNRSAAGFSVLWSDEGPLAGERLELGRAVARRMLQAGFVAYDGSEYLQQYEADAHQAGVFVDRHALDTRIFVLRQPTMRSVIVETHNARDDREAERWNEEATREAFAAAVAAALVDVLAGG